MTAVLIDSNVILDIATDDPVWGAWAAETLAQVTNESLLVINPLIQCAPAWPGGMSTLMLPLPPWARSFSSISTISTSSW